MTKKIQGGATIYIKKLEKMQYLIDNIRILEKAVGKSSKICTELAKLKTNWSDLTSCVDEGNVSLRQKE